MSSIKLGRGWNVPALSPNDNFSTLALLIRLEEVFVDDDSFRVVDAVAACQRYVAVVAAVKCRRRPVVVADEPVAVVVVAAAEPPSYYSLYRCWKKAVASSENPSC